MFAVVLCEHLMAFFRRLYGKQASLITAVEHWEERKDSVASELIKHSVSIKDYCLQHSSQLGDKFCKQQRCSRLEHQLSGTAQIDRNNESVSRFVRVKQTV